MPLQYDVYGIGNALVDLQYEVEPAFLARMGVEKGLMTLVDEERQQALMASVGGVPAKRSSGGSAANTMIGVTNLGGVARYACKVGRDTLGDFFLDDLDAVGVACNRGNRGDVDRTFLANRGGRFWFGLDGTDAGGCRLPELYCAPGG